jgi:hypothetical protein
MAEDVPFDVDLPMKFRVLGEKNWRDGRVLILSSKEIEFSGVLGADIGVELDIRLTLPGIRKGRLGGTLVSRARVMHCSPASVGSNEALVSAKLQNVRLLRSDGESTKDG